MSLDDPNVWSRPMLLPMRTGPGLQATVGAGGLLLGLRNPSEVIQRWTAPSVAAAAVESHSWKPRKVDATHITISPGYACGGVATIGGVGLDNIPAPQLAVGSGLVYVYLCVVWTPYVSEGVVVSGTVVSREITAESGLQTNTSTNQYFLLFTWQAGALVEQVRKFNFEGDCIDTGFGTSTPVYRTWPAAS